MLARQGGPPHLGRRVGDHERPSSNKQAATACCSSCDNAREAPVPKLHCLLGILISGKMRRFSPQAIATRRPPRPDTGPQVKHIEARFLRRRTISGKATWRVG
jgi:hypothetical protein